jgi:hypothetical protein
MSIRFHCPACGSQIEVKEEYVGQRANCPECWDPVRVPFRSEGSAPDLHGHSDDSDLLTEPLPQLVAHAVGAAARQHSLYFIAGSLILIGMMFLSCGGVGAVKHLWSSNSKPIPKKTTFDEPVRLNDLRQKME